MTNRQTITRFRQQTWIFVNITTEFDSYEIHPDMMDIKKSSDEI